MVKGEATAKSVHMIEGAKVDVEKTRLDALKSVPTSVLLGVAAQELAGKLQRIDHLNLAPDALGPMLQALMDAGTKKLEAKPEAK